MLLESYDRLAKSAPQGFMLRAFFPWVFVIVLNVAIYEMLIPDGRSLIDWFAGLKENLQVYAALALVISIAAIAGVSDGIVNQLVSRLRAANLRKDNDKDGSAPGGELGTAMLAKIEEPETSVHRSASLVIGFGVSIWLNAFELARYQPNTRISVTVIGLLFVCMAGSLTLAYFQIRSLMDLDREIVLQPKNKKYAKPPRAAKRAL